MQKSKVYIKTDEASLIVRVEGGYTMSNIDDISQWTYLDEGYGDKYNLCQSHYLDGGLLTGDGIYRYKLVDGVPQLRSDDEIEAARAARPAPSETVTTSEITAAIDEGVNSI